VSIARIPEMPASTVSTNDLRTLLDDVPDTLELVLRGWRAAEPEWSPVEAAWREAHEDADRALERWLAAPADRAAYSLYRAAQDREDAAQDALSQTQTARTRVS
jgi:hypothetical protein